MKSSLLEYIGIDPAFILIGMGITIILLIVINIVVLVKLKKISRKYNNFMNGKDAESLEDVVLKRFTEIDNLKQNQKMVTKTLQEIITNLQITYQKVGIVKYDAFKEMGGKLSFSLALLDNDNTGFVLNSMHSREGCYTYIKEIIKGNSYITLSDEEKEALEKAKKASNFLE